MTEFNLSDKIKYVRNEDNKIGLLGYPKEDVKEFIKVFIEKCKCNNCRDLIRELAGEELRK